MKNPWIIYRAVRSAEEVTLSAIEVHSTRIVRPGPSLKLWNHSPTGFEMGYGGSGPAQLALAILLDFTEDAPTSLAHYQRFKWAFITRWKGSAAEITGSGLLTWIDACRGRTGILPASVKSETMQ